jgi:DNA-binding transcriptional LysR family regulator
MNNLEHDLQVSLFNRTRKGVHLTKAGAFLLEEAPAYIQSGANLRRQLSAIASNDDVICVGTSMNHKLRLLYELWVLFSDAGKHYNIKLIHTDNPLDYRREAELIECIYADMYWQKGWDFLKVCDVPIGCGVSRYHPLAARKRLTYEDLKNQTALIIRHGSVSYWTRAMKDLASHQIQVKEVTDYSSSVMWELTCSNAVILAPLCWQDILFDTTMIPCDWDYTLPYGFCHRQMPSPHVREFLDFIDEVYHGDQWQGAVPVF